VQYTYNNLFINVFNFLCNLLFNICYYESHVLIKTIGSLSKDVFEGRKFCFSYKDDLPEILNQFIA